MRRIPCLLVGLVALAGCLLRTADPPRFFRPGSVTLDAPEDEVAPPAPGAIAIRLRGVRSEPFLRERIVWRVSELEYGLYGQRRWIDLPEHYVERALRTRLRATSGLRLTDDLRAPTLHVRVLAFDDRLAPAHTANVALAVTLEDREHGRFLERTFNARVGIDDGDPASMAEAMGQALDDAVAQVADAVRVSVRARGVHFPE
ncbi:MAG: hypothetical protein E6J71_03250 [Deltaproteobacteria bacterium]|nr:MAG: hypothetical protein E6J81_04465 [Deltaproteobacteria bacterium]TMA82993.1 MAG: hypothetical protein E6J77_14995 [Deltaproteobacteria bacterium]TMB23667.1 MAG: hypothetical protein E6J71_03250 [Deltaproteobacteria bacterium]